MSFKNIKKQAEKAINSIDSGREFPSNYVMNRFDHAWDKYQKDQVIGNMRNVITKMASKKRSFSQKEITDIYDRYNNISGGDTAFRHELGDLIMEGYGKPSEPVRADFSKTARENPNPVSIKEQTPLSDAFSVLFSLGANSNDSMSYNKNMVKKAERMVYLELNSLGLTPHEVKTVNGNEHFILCNAYYKNKDFSTTHISIPVQISDSKVGIPSEIVSEGNLIKLNKENILVHLKTAQNTKKDTNISKYADLRQSESLTTPSVKVPSALKEKFSLSDEVILASNKYSHNQINAASSMLASEVGSWGARAQIKFAGTNKKGMTFLVKTATSVGEKSFIVPVEISINKMTMPSEFISESTKFDFSVKGYNQFMSGAKVASTGSFSRDPGELNNLSYAQLMDVVLEGVAKKDYKASEDALSVVGSKFGPERFKIALEDFQKFIKVSSQKFDEELIKNAVSRGDLIRTKTSFEWFCPKLGLPLSKIAFDEKGRPVPKFRTEKRNLESIEGTLISNSKIIMS